MKKLIILIAFCVAGWLPAQSQSYFQSPKNIGLGGGGVTYMQDYRTNFVNPANLSLSDTDSKWVFNLPFLIPSISAQAGGSLLKVSAFNDYFTTGLTIDNTMLENEVLPAFFDDDDQKFTTQLNIMLFGISYRSDKLFGLEEVGLSLAGRTRVLVNGQANEGMARLLLGGANEKLFGETRDVNFNVTTTAFSEISLGYSMKAYEFEFMNAENKIYAGIAPKMLISNAYMGADIQSQLQVRKGEFIRHTMDYTIDATGGLVDGLNQYIADREQYPDSSMFTLFENGEYFDSASDGVADINGMGFGLDFGVTYQFNPYDEKYKLAASLSITDIGSANFNSGASTFNSNGTFFFDGLDYDTDRIDNEFDGVFGDYAEFVLKDSLADEGYGNLTEQNSSFTQALPTSLNFGVRGDYEFNNSISTMATLDYVQGFNTEGINTTKPIFILGNEWKLWGFWPIRWGARFGGSTSSALSFGTGLEFKHVEFSFGTIGSISTDSGFRGGVAVGGFIIKI
jgi:hypothetical protein